MTDQTMNVPDQSTEATCEPPVAQGDRIREAAQVLSAMGTSEDEIAAKLGYSTAILQHTAPGR